MCGNLKNYWFHRPCLTDLQYIYFSFNIRNFASHCLACCPIRIFFLSEQDYYGKRLQRNSDLQTNACVTPAQPIPSFVRDALKKVHPEVSAKSVVHDLFLKPKGSDAEVLLIPSGTTAVVWLCQSAWRAAGYWTWAVEVGGTASCWVC